MSQQWNIYETRVIPKIERPPSCVKWFPCTGELNLNPHIVVIVVAVVQTQLSHLTLYNGSGWTKGGGKLFLAGVVTNARYLFVGRRGRITKNNALVRTKTFWGDSRQRWWVHSLRKMWVGGESIVWWMQPEIRAPVLSVANHGRGFYCY